LTTNETRNESSNGLTKNVAKIEVQKEFISAANKRFCASVAWRNKLEQQINIEHLFQLDGMLLSNNKNNQQKAKKLGLTLWADGILVPHLHKAYFVGCHLR